METIATNHRMHSVYNIMRITYAVVPIVAGLDKFTNLLTNWEQYISDPMTEKDTAKWQTDIYFPVVPATGE